MSASPSLSAANNRSSWLTKWLMASATQTGGTVVHHHERWWKVMCLTGVDYFSTLGYQPGIAFLAAGVLSPFATLVLVLVTLFVALPVYSQVAARSPHGQGSILMIEELLPRWRGKAFVLVLLGFAFTDFIITITLSAADAAAHIIENPLVPQSWHHHPILITSFLIALLGIVFLRGFREVIGLAVFIVGCYLLLNLVVMARGVYEVFSHPTLVANWKAALFQAHGSPLAMIGVSALLFPKLALGLSGFETGVAVMPLVKGDPQDTQEAPTGRIRKTQRLLLTAALIMSVSLLVSAWVTTLLIPADAFAAGGDANGRALAFIAHRYLGEVFGTAYDVATIVILWFAGASAMAGLLNLVPRYLPPYGMAPDWALAARPLVLVFTAIAFFVTWQFRANVDAQAGAYATGVLFLMTSAAVAVTIAHWESSRRWLYLTMAAIFIYTTATNIHERPEGLKIASLFILAIVVVSLGSRAVRSTELSRIRRVELSEKAVDFINDVVARGTVCVIAHRPDKRTAEEYEKKERQARADHSLDKGEPVVFLEVIQGDASDFTEDLKVFGFQVGRHKILRCGSPAVPNAIAALLIHIRDQWSVMPNAYFGWTEGNPLGYALRYVLLGEGDTAPVTREILRRAIKEPRERPKIHVG